MRRGALPIGRFREAAEDENGDELIRIDDGGLFLEAQGSRFRIRVIEAGLSANSNLYPAAVLREAVALFEGVRVFAKSDKEHLAGAGKDVRNLIGVLQNAAFVEGRGAGDAQGEIQADLILLEPEGAIAVKLREAIKQGVTSAFGFSIDARASVRQRRVAGKAVREAQKFIDVASVDLIVEPGAGGALINLIEAKEDNLMDREQIIALLEAKGLLKGKDVEALSDDALTTILRESIVNPAAEDDDDDAIDPDAVTAADLRMVEARITARDLIGASELPASAKARLRARFDAAERFTEAEVKTAIEEEAEYIGQFSEAGAVVGHGDTIRIESGESRAEKVDAMLDAFFDPSSADHRHARSFRECYRLITGDRRVTGRQDDCDEALLRESLATSNFSNVLGNSMHRTLIRDYRTPTSYDIWRQLAQVVNINDFRPNERTRFGGYGDLPAVAEGAAYAALTSPTDEKASYAVTKRGGTEDLTLEMIRNDDVGSIRQIPVKLSRASKRTLSKFVLDFIRTNAAIYDAVALFHVNHNNLLTAALSKAALAAARLQMLKQTELDSGDRLGIPPKYLWVPSDLEETAVDLFRRNTENDKTFVATLALEVMPVWYWTDANDWFITADYNDVPTIEVGFLDGNEEPELFVQDNPTVGSMFSNDKLTYKLRHIFGGTVIDYRGFQGNVVV